MKVDTIVTLGEGKKYYLVDETIQNGEKYFLATRLDENEMPIAESEVFKETKKGEDYYLNPVKDPEILNYLSAIFIANFNKIIEEEENND